MAPLGGVNRTTDFAMVCIYIIQSLKDKGYYIGICEDIEKRLLKHNSGGVKSTKYIDL